MSTAEEQFLTSLLLAQGRTGEAAQLALEATPSARREDEAQKPTKPALGLPRGSGRREKVFGMGRPRALDRNAKVRIMHWARCLSRRTEKGRAYGQLTAKAVAVLEALLWGFHNAKSGFCFPSYERIAEAAGCARSSVTGALHALEDCGILSWVNRIKRVRERCPDLLGANGWRWRVLRTSNAYHFRDPGAPEPSKANFQTGTPNRVSFPTLEGAYGAKRPPSPTAKEAFEGISGRIPLPDGVFLRP
jgi:Helix-turn-helix domain